MSVTGRRWQLLRNHRIWGNVGTFRITPAGELRVLGVLRLKTTTDDDWSTLVKGSDGRLYSISNAGDLSFELTRLEPEAKTEPVYNIVHAHVIGSGLCRHHHRQVHEGRVVVQVLDDGALRFVRPDGASFQSVAPDHTRPLSDWRQLPQNHGQQGIHIDKNTAITRWRGERMDYGLAINVLLQHAKRGARVSAESAH